MAIDWHLDPKSGYRWSSRLWYKFTYRRTRPPADLKLPWELGRLQFLTDEIVDAIGENGGEPLTAEIIDEFRSVVIDFGVANPPRWGVQWASTMDVAIRLCNLILGYDLLRSAGATLDEPFEDLFSRIVVDHARHIAANLENRGVVTGNHYLANLLGLICAGTYLLEAEEADRWLTLGYSALVEQVCRQFNADGSNWEGSTAYHRLSTEIVLVAVALLVGAAEDGRAPLRRKPLFPEAFLGRVCGAVEFARKIRKPDGLVPQIGDNDSGRVFTSFDRNGADPRALDFSHLDDAADGLFRPGKNASIWAGLMTQLARGRAIQAVPATVHDGTGGEAIFRQARACFENTAPQKRVVHRYRLPHGGGLAANYCGFPDFGLYVWTHENWYMAVRCGPVGQGGRGGHSHNDQLHTELWVRDGVIMRDPGSFVYTSHPHLRDRYRSAAAHFAPRLEGIEPAGFDGGVFRLLNAVPGHTLYARQDGFLGVYNGFGPEVIRLIEIREDAILIRDYVNCEGHPEKAFLSEAPQVRYSPKFGELE